MLGMYEVGGEVAVTEESYICHKSETQNWFFLHTEFLLVFYNNIVFVLFCQSRSFNPSLCHLLQFFFAHSKYKASKYIDNETKKTNDNCNTYAMKPYYIFTVG